MVKKAVSVVLALCLVLSFAGCSLFSNSAIVKLGDYTHNDPKDLKYDMRIVLKGEGFGNTVADYLSSDAYPDTMYYDESGNVVGMYDYDATTGLAKGWTNISDGTYTAFPEGEEVDLGMPDESKIVDVPGDATLYFVVYGSGDKAVFTDMYVMLTDAAAKDVMISGVQSVFGLTLTAESDTVLKMEEDESTIDADFASLESMGYTVDGKDANAYSELLQQSYGVRPYGGVNPYKPYAEHKDPEGLDFDEKIVLTGSGEAAVTEEYASDVSSQTDYLYGKDGSMVAQYTYIECKSKDAAEKILAESYPRGEILNDTVILNKYEGQDMQDLIAAYKGYNVLKDNSVSEYVRMSEETYYTSEYEG